MSGRRVMRRLFRPNSNDFATSAALVEARAPMSTNLNVSMLWFIADNKDVYLLVVTRKVLSTGRANKKYPPKSLADNSLSNSSMV